MAKPAQQRETHRSFTVRIPESLYEEIGDLASGDGVFVNIKVNQLLRLGLGHHISLDAAVARMLKKEVTNG
jgi:predicted HicB family RNase H-like nuclease